ncbi:MAG: HD domain-containing phosphohydrolase [Bryobacteraceae bacterium]|jgi:HD-GYP domain-containing protein (c-di-GMP phosphodiesterase class II)
MRFATRTFLLSFVPISLLLLGSFWAVQILVQRAVRDQLQASLRQTHESVARMQSKKEARDGRLLRILGESSTLKAGLQLLLAAQNSRDARITVEDQLREMSEQLGFDFLMISDPAGKPLAGVFRVADQLAPIDLSRTHPPLRGLLTLDRLSYQIVSTSIDQGEENLGTLSVGERLDFSGFSTPVALEHRGAAVESTLPGISLAEVQTSLQGCGEAVECEVSLRGDTYLSASMKSASFGDGYSIRTFQNLDAANRPVRGMLHGVFLIAGVGALLAAMILSALSSRSIVKPIRAVVERLRESEITGVLPEFRALASSIQEIGELTDSFNHAGAAIREARDTLQHAYVEFVGSLASALDARDPYTAGHSRRVSEYSLAIGRQLGLDANQLDELRIGALLHDIGKIGIPDKVLQKVGALTNEEFALLRQHPTIGRRILEGVKGFHPYLPVVELHHENWNGKGYPLGLEGETTPLQARIVKIADAYDAMTSDRPYRPGMSDAEAVRRLEAASGTEFDFALVKAFIESGVHAQEQPSQSRSLRNLGIAVGIDSPESVQSEQLP